MGGVGATLREARTGRGVELSEVEAATKIRRRFLDAIENEAWDVLPGPAYAAGFVRAYADYLGLDGARMAAECPLRPSPPVPDRTARSGPRRRIPPAVAVSVGLIVVIGIVGLLWGGGGNDGGTVSTPAGGGVPASAQGAGGSGSAVPSVRHTSETNSGSRAMELSLTTTAELWVCLLGKDGKPLVDGLVLPPGAEEGPFHSGSFTVSFGNGEVEMRIDGRDSEIPESASPLGYEVGPGGDLSPLGESERPTCT